MKKFVHVFSIMVILAFVLGSCGPKSADELPTPVVEKTSAPDIEPTALSYLEAWQNRDYATMYGFLSQQSQEVITQEAFTKLLTEFSNNMTLASLVAEVTSTATSPTSASAKFLVNYATSLFGDFSRQPETNWVLENNEWKLVWDNGAFLPELAGGNTLALESRRQERGNIYDRNGEPLVEETTAYALGITPGEIEEGREGQLVYRLSQLTGKTTQSIYASYEDAGATWYVPVGEVSADEIGNQFNTLLEMGGLVLSEFTSRYYYGGGIAPQAIGYVLGMSEEQQAEYIQKGYLGDESVGQAGLEKYAEEALAGKPSASLYVVNPDGQVVTRISQADPTPAQSITTTFDKNLQIETQKAIAGFKGAAIVMEVDSGRILAMASSPNFDPNLFNPSNINSAELLSGVLNDKNQSLLNRATQGLYPLGSVFKIVTMAAALESDLYTADSSYYCSYYFEELPGERFEDWTLDKGYDESGELTLVEGLMRSCNPWFYHLGLDLFRQMGATYLSDMARGFGLGSATGIEQVAEDIGSIPDPKTDGNAVQQGIGQGEMLVTPLQVVRFIAAIANGGTLYRPQLIESMTSSTGVTTYTFSPEEQGTLPISQTTLETIREGMGLVISSRRGTAHDALSGLNITMYGKTGTATNSTGDPHAWFAGYTDTNREDKPDIAVVVLIENGGEGSEVAAPVFRRIIETYYFGEPLKLYPWESEFNVTRTPTLEFTLTPTQTPYREPVKIEPTETPAG
ncbi:MAG TPA: penicillin-binding transpeptidase domain-containing protein [Anaerolineaceae bacterium]|nr:penicillin-binding transpeptidase domain-containing protein [Anaerolineaceae bacterium]